jgi:hypothetical protein
MCPISDFLIFFFGISQALDSLDDTIPMVPRNDKQAHNLNKKITRRKHNMTSHGAPQQLAGTEII